MNHTPGPWKTKHFDGEQFPIIEDKKRGKLVAIANTQEWAHLIAAAPEMYDLLNKVARLLMSAEDETPEIGLYIEIEEMLKKAEGVF